MTGRSAAGKTLARQSSACAHQARGALCQNAPANVPTRDRADSGSPWPKAVGSMSALSDGSEPRSTYHSDAAHEPTSRNTAGIGHPALDHLIRYSSERPSATHHCHGSEIRLPGPEPMRIVARARRSSLRVVKAFGRVTTR